MTRSYLTPILLRGCALALLVGGLAWALAAIAGGWIGAEALGLTPEQARALMHPILALLLIGLPGVYVGLRTGQSWLLLAGAILTGLGLLIMLFGGITAYGATGQGGSVNGELTIGIGTVLVGVGALVMALGLIRQGGSADWISVLLAALGLTVIPGLLDTRLAVLPGLCWAALGVTVWLASAEIEAEMRHTPRRQ